MKEISEQASDTTTMQSTIIYESHEWVKSLRGLNQESVLKSANEFLSKTCDFEQHATMDELVAYLASMCLASMDETSIYVLFHVFPVLRLYADKANPKAIVDKWAQTLSEFNQKSILKSAKEFLEKIYDYEQNDEITTLVELVKELTDLYEDVEDENEVKFLKLVQEVILGFVKDDDVEVEVEVDDEFEPIITENSDPNIWYVLLSSTADYGGTRSSFTVYRKLKYALERKHTIIDDWMHDDYNKRKEYCKWTFSGSSHRGDDVYVEISEMDITHSDEDHSVYNNYLNN